MLSDTVSGMKASFLHLLGLIANNEKRYPQAIEYFSNAMEVCDNLMINIVIVCLWDVFILK